MAYRVLISDEALGDLDAITGFIKEHGSPDAARKWLQGVLDTIGSLSVMPERCLLAPKPPMLVLQCGFCFMDG